MTIPGLQVDLDADTPVYRQIADGVRSAALGGRLRPGTRLPPTRDLARQLGVNRNTVVAAYDALAEEGWVRSHTGRGTFLVARPESAADGAEPIGGRDPWFSVFSRAVEGAAQSGFQSIYGLVVDPVGISFVGSYPAGELIPAEEFGRALQKVIRLRGPEILTYGPTTGLPSLRETIARDMRRRGSPAGADDVLITNGAQQALELVFRSFVERGDAVVVEESTYTGALSVLSSLGGRPIGIPMDADGVRPDLLEVALERHRPRLIYLQPTFHNPTARETTEARRREVLAVAERYRCPIVEDDWGGDLRFEGDPLPTLHALDGGRHVIYLGTFSKKLMPGLRVGWVAAPPPVLGRLVELKRLEDCGTSPLIQAGLDVFLQDGGLVEHLDRILPAYRARRDRMMDALDRHFPDGAKWARPRGGLFVWVRLPEPFDGDDLFVAARQNGVSYSRGELFHSDGSGRHAMRLTFSTASEEQIDAGLETLGRLIRERLAGGAEAARQSVAESVPIF